MTDSDCHLSPDAIISSDARIFPSNRGTRIVIGAHTHIMEFVVIKAVGGTGDIVIGEHCYINPQCVLYSGNGIRMGNYVLIAAGTMVVPSNHGIECRHIPMRRQPFAESKGGVIIEDDVWVGANCVLLDGAYLEKGCVITAGSVVNKRVPTYEVWGGVPAKRIKMRP